MREDFWNDNQEAQTILKNISTLQEPVDKFHQFWQEANYLNDMLDMAENENEPELLADTVRELETLLKEFREFEMEILFSGPHDAQDAIVAMHAGAGGTEAQDWV
ncbi:MAG TPA: peptide chain release factor 2, partial [Syntrophomonas sp.]|nr:peptide chain release factor 2 [Syntrophomonas sp.]